MTLKKFFIKVWLVCIIFSISQTYATPSHDIVYVSVRQSNAILTFDLNNKTGDLKLKDSLPCPGGPAPMAFSPNQKYLYVGERESNTFSAYTINPGTGKLKFLNRITAINNPVNLEVDKSGKYLLSVYYHSGQAAVYRINSDGSLRDSAVQVLSGFTNPHAIHVDIANKFAFITDKGGDRLYGYIFDSHSGKMILDSSATIITPAGTEPRHFVLVEKNKRAYVINEKGNSVTTYKFDAKNGTLWELQTISTLPDTNSQVSKCADIHISPNGKYLYASNRGNNSIAVYKITDKDHLLYLSGVYPTISKPRSFSINSSGKYLIASDEAGTEIALHKVDNVSGALSKMMRFRVGELPFWVLFKTH